MNKIKTKTQLENYVEKKAAHIEDIKNKEYIKDVLADFKDNNLPNPFDVVRDFIIEKGLKLYGGQAIHEHLSKKNKPIYNDYELPDYDVFSPDAWNHAQELCDHLYSLGFFFVEAKASIINDSKHQTYKVSVDLVYVLDLTQIGCSADQLKLGDCDECGISLDKKCYSFFNNIPAIDILSDTNEEITESYDYSKKTGKYKDKLLVCSPDWLKISMYLELTQPFNDPSRLEKVFSRLNLFEEEFDFNKCGSILENFQKIDTKTEKLYETSLVISLLNFTEKTINEHKLLHYGSTAYNFYINGTKYPEEKTTHFEVYTDEDPDRYYEDILEKLKSKFSKDKIKFKLVPRIMYWKDVDSDNYDILFSISNKNYRQLVTFTKTQEQMPYIEYKNIRYATFDRMKYIYYRCAVLPDIINMSEYNIRNYKCLLKNLVDIEENMKKKQKVKLLSGKYRSFVHKCFGAGEVNKLIGNLYENFGKNVKMSKQTKIYIDTPKKGFITKIYPSQKDSIIKMYRPAEKKTKYYNKILKIQDMNIKKKSRVKGIPIEPYQSNIKQLKSRKRKPLLKNKKFYLKKKSIQKNILKQQKSKQQKSKKIDKSKLIDIKISNELLP